MERKAGKYALVQFCPVPERLEFLNVGIVLIVPDLNFVGVRISKSNARIERLFGKQSHSYIDNLKESFKFRVRSELSHRFNEDYFENFAQKRANDIRLSPLQSIMVGDPNSELNALFLELVGSDEIVHREPRIRKKLREAFIANRVDHYLEKPDEINLPEYGLKISAPFGYQNGCYNLVDGIRVSDNTSEGLRELGKKAIEGNLLWKHFEGKGPGCKRLIIVGDFSQQSNAFFHAADEQLRDANMKLFRLDDLRPLLNDIAANASLHS